MLPFCLQFLNLFDSVRNKNTLLLKAVTLISMSVTLRSSFDHINKTLRNLKGLAMCPKLPTDWLISLSAMIRSPRPSPLKKKKILPVPQEHGRFSDFSQHKKYSSWPTLGLCTLSQYQTLTLYCVHYYYLTLTLYSWVSTLNLIEDDLISYLEFYIQIINVQTKWVTSNSSLHSSAGTWLSQSRVLLHTTELEQNSLRIFKFKVKNKKKRE